MLYHHQQVPLVRTVPPEKSRLFPRKGLPDRHHEPTRLAREFADSHYLRHLISHLRQLRMQQGLGLRALARKAGIRTAVIQRAELQTVIPCSRDFKAWVIALGLSWEQVWSEVLDHTHAGRAA